MKNEAQNMNISIKILESLFIRSNHVSVSNTNWIQDTSSIMMFHGVYTSMLLDRGQSSPKSVPREKEQPSRRSSASAPPVAPLKRLRSSCVVVRMDDLDIHQASSTNHRSLHRSPHGVRSALDTMGKEPALLYN